MNFNQGFILCAFFISPVFFFAQVNPVISGEYSKTNAAEVIQDIGRRYDIAFAYDSYSLAAIEGTWRFNNVSLDEALADLFEGRGLKYQWKDKTVIIYWDDKPVYSAQNALTEKKEIFGEVRDARTRELLPFAVLSFRNDLKNVTCNADGTFYVDEILLSEDTVDVFFVGYEMLSLPTSEMSGQRNVVLFLQPNRNYLPDVLVTATAKYRIRHSDQPSLYTLNPANMAMADGLGERDLLRTVQLLPGVSATQETNSGIFIRGSNSDQTMMSLDGFTIYHQDHFFGTFTAVNANAVKSMRINKGAMEAKYGGRVAGVLEMIGREGDLRNNHTQIDIGTLAVGAVIEAPMDTAGKSSVFISGRRAITDAVFSPAYKALFNHVYNNAIVTENEGESSTFGGSSAPDFYFQDVNVKFTYRPAAGTALNVSGYLSKDQLAIQYADTLGNQNTSTRDVFYSDESLKKNAGGSVRWTKRINPHWESLMSLGISEFEGTFFSADTIRELLFQTDSSNFSFENNTLRDLNFRAELTGYFKRNEISSGVQINRIVTDRKYNDQGVVTDGEPSEETVFTIFAGDKFDISPAFSLQPGVRLNYYTGTERIYPEPRLLAIYKPGFQNIGFKFGACRTSQFIQRVQNQNLYLNTPDYWQLADGKELNVLQTDQLTFGTVWSKHNWGVDFELFHKWNDGNAFIPGPYARPADGQAELPVVLSGKGIAKGADLAVERDFNRHHIMFSYSLLQATGTFDLLEQKKVTEVFEQRHEIKMSYQISLARWTMGVMGVYGSGRPYTPLLGSYDLTLLNGQQLVMPLFGDLNSARLPDYHRIDVTAAYEFRIGKARANIIASVYNVYNRKNIRDIQYLAVRTGDNANDYNILGRELQMISFLPSLNFRLNY